MNSRTMRGIAAVFGIPVVEMPLPEPVDLSLLIPPDVTLMVNCQVAIANAQAAQTWAIRQQEEEMEILLRNYGR